MEKKTGIVDMHCDTLSELLAAERAAKAEGLCQNQLQISIPKLKKAGYILQSFAIYVNLKKCNDPWQEAREQFRIFTREMQENTGYIGQVKQYSDIEKNQKTGKISALLTAEEGGICGGSLKHLEEIYQWGVRMMTLTWNYPNELCTEDGLTKTGYSFLEKMEETGMIADVSHLHDAGFYQLLDVTKKPFVASHSNARAVCLHKRNLTDEMIRRIAERGGVIGLNFYVPFILPETERLGSKMLPDCEKKGFEETVLEGLSKHAAHILRIGGEDCLGLGSDFDGIPLNPALPGPEALDGLWDALVKTGISERQADKIFGENVLRLYREML